MPFSWSLTFLYLDAVCSHNYFDIAVCEKYIMDDVLQIFKDNSRRLPDFLAVGSNLFLKKILITVIQLVFPGAILVFPDVFVFSKVKTHENILSSFWKNSSH